ncbi:MAG: hypothetical protein RJA17_75, partial [Pseudomonadota bacterium]
MRLECDNSMSGSGQPENAIGAANQDRIRTLAGENAVGHHTGQRVEPILPGQGVVDGQ